MTLNNKLNHTADAIRLMQVTARKSSVQRVLPHEVVIICDARVE